MRDGEGWVGRGGDEKRRGRKGERSRERQIALFVVVVIIVVVVVVVEALSSHHIGTAVWGGVLP